MHIQCCPGCTHEIEHLQVWVPKVWVWVSVLHALQNAVNIRLLFFTHSVGYRNVIMCVFMLNLGYETPFMHEFTRSHSSAAAEKVFQKPCLEAFRSSAASLGSVLEHCRVITIQQTSSCRRLADRHCVCRHNRFARLRWLRLGEFEADRLVCTRDLNVMHSRQTFQTKLSHRRPKRPPNCGGVLAVM